MNAVFIIPTGIGCSIGGHAGDATPAAKLIAQVCDTLILHPNVVNASDINEMPPNSLYVEGSILDRFLRKEIELNPVYSNKIGVLVNKPTQNDTINAVNASITTIGMDATIIELDTPLTMNGWVEDGLIATGKHSGVPELIEQVKHLDFDGFAIATEIHVDNDESLKYFRTGGVNPWGGIEAQVSRLVATALNKPVAHAPIESDNTKNDDELFWLPFNEVVDARIAAEVISNCYLHCVMKGLHKAPKVGGLEGFGIDRDTVNALVSPMCWGVPHEACAEAGIPIIMVEENLTAYNETNHRSDVIYVKNYLEACGVLTSIKAGISIKSIGLDNDVIVS